MSAKTGGSLATVLMSVPLAAIPLMAIFGIPQFTTVVASPDNAGRDIIIEPDANLGQPLDSVSNHQRSTEIFDDAPPFSSNATVSAPSLLNPFDSETSRGAAVTTDPRSEQETAGNTDVGTGGVDWPEQQFGAGQGDTLSDGHAIFADEIETDSTASASLPADPHPMSWRTATRRLQELGIDNYHLERGQSLESFLFVCSFEPAGTTNVVMRFEAEADEPLTAVNDVLEQIDRWLRRTFAETRQAALISGESAQ